LSSATARESPQKCELSVCECARLRELGSWDVAPSRGDLESGRDLGDAARGDAIVMRAVFANSTVPFDHV
jgi:hypothetical protein